MKIYLKLNKLYTNALKQSKLTFHRHLEEWGIPMKPASLFVLSSEKDLQQVSWLAK